MFRFTFLRFFVSKRKVTAKQQKKLSVTRALKTPFHGFQARLSLAKLNYHYDFVNYYMLDNLLLLGCFVFYALLIILYPLLSKVLRASQYALLLGGTLFFFLSLFILEYWSTIFNGVTVSWISTNLTASLGTIPFLLNFFLNPLSYSFSLLVILIGATTNIYILTYFKGEASESNFIFWVNAFVISMLVLVFANNLFTLFLGWELIGLTSFFLINFWSNRRATLKSSFKAFIFNLFSDICLLGSFVILYYLVGSDDCQVIFYSCLYTNIYQHYLFDLSILLLILCCSIKSVQIFGHLWLPDSMEAPVPASSLIHSATLVSAGIFLLCKFSLLLELSSWGNYVIILGSLSALYGGVVAASQTDMKKLLAYSTMSHCGFLWVLACLGQFYITIIYLFLHGIFKAATFYCAGTFIRVFGTQDTRWMGNGLKLFSSHSLSLLIASANLCGLPFSVGYLYKFFFFKVLYTSFSSSFVISCLFLAAQTSLVYFYRLTFYALFDYSKTVKQEVNFFLSKTKVKLNAVRFGGRLNHQFSFLFLIIFSILFSLAITNVELFIPLSQVFFVENNLLVVSSGFEFFYATYYIFFYAFYLALLYYLVFVTNRSSLNALYSQTGFLYSGLCLLFFKFICELTLWVNHPL